MTLTGLTEALLNALARRQGRHKYVSRFVAIKIAAAAAIELLLGRARALQEGLQMLGEDLVAFRDSEGPGADCERLSASRRVADVWP